jgi:curli biogenesis system outer membrane secretion channel CsgG
MPHVLPRVTIAEISADQNVCKIVYENNFNLLNVAFTGVSRAEAEKSRLQRATQMQVLEAANVCDLTDAANAKRDLDECKGRAERAE